MTAVHIVLQWAVSAGGGGRIGRGPFRPWAVTSGDQINPPVDVPWQCSPGSINNDNGKYCVGFRPPPLEFGSP